jgi:hypothetical protein
VRPSEPSLPRPKSRLLDSFQRLEFLRLLNDGLGWTTSRLRLGIGLRDLKQTIATCVDFRRALAEARKARVERLEAVLYQAALQGDLEAARYLLDRHERGAERRRHPSF